MKLRADEILHVETGGQLLILPDTKRVVSKGSHPLIVAGIDPDTHEPYCEPAAFATVHAVRREWLALIDSDDVAMAGLKRPEDVWKQFQRRYKIRDYDMPEAKVQLVHIEYERLQRPRFIANQQGQVDPNQYETSAARCIDDEAGEAPPDFYVEQLAAASSTEGDQIRAAKIAKKREEWQTLIATSRKLIEEFDPGDDVGLQRKKRKARRVLDEKEAA